MSQGLACLLSALVPAMPAMPASPSLVLLLQQGSQAWTQMTRPKVEWLPG